MLVLSDTIGANTIYAQEGPDYLDFQIYLVSLVIIADKGV